MLFLIIIAVELLYCILNELNIPGLHSARSYLFTAPSRSVAGMWECEW